MGNIIENHVKVHLSRDVGGEWVVDGETVDGHPLEGLDHDQVGSADPGGETCWTRVELKAAQADVNQRTLPSGEQVFHLLAAALGYQSTPDRE